MKCEIFIKCGGCQYIDKSYDKTLELKQQEMVKLLGEFGKVQPVIGMDAPLYYRNKVHHVFGYRKGQVLAGFYREGTHDIVDVGECLIEDKKSQEIIATIKKLVPSFKIKTYNEDTGYGLLRHVLVRRAFSTGEIMVVLVLSSTMLPGKNNFVKALRKEHPEITTIVINVNNEKTTMVLGDREQIIYGPGFIKDKLCGITFRISAKSFYQINPVQTEKLYRCAIDHAGLTGHETVIDAYCGIGTIGLAAAEKCHRVIGIELNKDAVRDAITNARENKITNVQFYTGDAGKYMEQMAANGQKADVVFMDPPRSGSTKQFIDAVAVLSPKKVVYVSCGPDTLARDLKLFIKKGYEVRYMQPIDMFPFTRHCEVVVVMSRK
ncbi:MAG: 23S rRNA (uracil(1939)-C(5))-methyltransferase RlmD [Pseudobutyrivibrio sp.]|nr:23S rRNA (uracil(1939)-C(5))-methyltransferase RlmD [Pseudobutyrivibrio sp.]